MLRRLFILVIFFLLMLAAAVAWNIRQAGKPMVPEEIPDWKIIQENKGHMLLQSVSEPVRKTEAWLEGPDDRIGCDTLIMLAGAETGHDFFQLSPEIIQKANTIFLVQPFQNFAKNLEKPEDINDWDIMDWWNLPQRFRWEYLQNLGAMKALVDHIQSRRIKPSSRFSDRIILAGGSAGAPVPAMITGFYPEKISGLMIIFGFTNIVAVIKNQIYRQGLIRLKITESDEGFQVLLQRSILKIFGSIFSVILGNMLKYGEIELYLQEVQNTPIHFINGSRDHLISDETYLPMWENTPEPKSEMWLKGGHIDPSNPEEVKRIMNLMDEWVESQNLRECQN